MSTILSVVFSIDKTKILPENFGQLGNLNMGLALVSLLFIDTCLN